MSQARLPSRRNKRLPIHREWRVPAALPSLLVENFARQASLSPEVAAVLLNRSGGDPELARLIKDPQPANLPDVEGLPGMREAARRISRAISRDERIVAYSDFDADGVTSAAILKEALQLAGAPRTSVYLPSRFVQGYGFHASSVKEIAAGGPCLFITSDCGITGFDACEEALRLGCDVIVTDHHLPGECLPKAHSVLDPHMASWQPYGLTKLTGAGVAYLLATALFRSLHIEDKVPPNWAHDLLALSIAGDGHPVLGLNRAWVTSGLAVLKEAGRPGIAALLEVASICQGGSVRPLSFDRDVTFGLVPRLNAAGRISDAHLAYEILVERDADRAHLLAIELDRLNQKRRGIEENIMSQCLEDLESAGDDSYAVCASRPEWHEGVIGIAASKLRETFGRPAVLAGGEGEILKGSVRGIPGFNVVEALSKCSDLLAGFGGHEAAGGFTVRRDAVAEFFKKFDVVSTESLKDLSISQELQLDEVLALNGVSDETLRGFFGLEPFGYGNTIPLAACMDCEVEQVNLMGRNRNHLQVVLSKDGVSKKFLWFGRGGDARDIALMGRIDVAFIPHRSMYLGEEQVTPLIRDARPSLFRSGSGYDELVEIVRAISRGSVLVYTWSKHAAESMRAAFRKAGIKAITHVEGETRVQSHDARLILRGQKGVVISTAPWELEGTPDPSLEVKALLAHFPVKEVSAERLCAFVSQLATPHAVWSGWEKDSLNWLSWSAPEKDTVGSMWNTLKSRSSGGRLTCSVAARLCDELANGSFDGARLLVERSLAILEELGMVEYVESRCMPEVTICRKGERILLTNSPSYVQGKALREGAEKTRLGRFGAYLFDRRGSQWT